MPNRAKDWLAQGRRDLELARHAGAGGFHEWACFAGQQGAEKSVKGLIAALNGEARGHAIVVMAGALPPAAAFPPQSCSMPPDAWMGCTSPPATPTGSTAERPRTTSPARTHSGPSTMLSESSTSARVTSLDVGALRERVTTAARQLVAANASRSSPEPWTR